MHPIFLTTTTCFRWRHYLVQGQTGRRRAVVVAEVGRWLVMTNNLFPRPSKGPCRTPSQRARPITAAAWSPSLWRHHEGVGRSTSGLIGVMRPQLPNLTRGNDEVMQRAQRGEGERRRERRSVDHHCLALSPSYWVPVASLLPPPSSHLPVSGRSVTAIKYTWADTCHHGGANKIRGLK